MSDDKKTDAIRKELFRIASVLVQCNYLPSSLPDDYHQKTYTAGRVAKMMENGHNNSKNLAVDLRRIIDLI